MNEEAALHQAMEENPHDATTQLAYADWLDEHGMPSTAAIVRKAGERAGKALLPFYKYDPPFKRHQVSIYLKGHKTAQLGLELPYAHKPGSFYFSASFPTSEAKRILRGLRKERSKLELKNQHKRYYWELMRAPETPTDKLSRRRFAANKEEQEYEESIPWEKVPKKVPQRPFTTPAKNIVRGEVKSPTWNRLNPSRALGTRFYEPVGGSRTLHPSLHGSRLAVILHEIRDRFGKKAPYLAKLADLGLRGVGNIGNEGDTYNRIQKALLRHATGKPMIGMKENFTPEESKRMGQLAQNYNWHRVGKGLQLDEMVADYINKIAKNRLKSQNSQFRAAHNLFGIGWNQREKPVSNEARSAFFQGLIGHVRKHGVGGESTYGMRRSDVDEKMLLRSIRRLGQAEQQAEELRGAHPTTRVSANEPDVPAWTRTKRGIRVNPKARAGQYSRRQIVKYGLLETLRARLGGRRDVPSLEGILYTSHPEGQYNLESHAGVNAEYSAVRHALHAIGILPDKPRDMPRDLYDRQVHQLVGKFVDHARHYIRTNPGDMLSRYYLDAANKLRVPYEEAGEKGQRPSFNHAPIGIVGLSTAIAPLLRKISEDRGIRPKRAMIAPEHPYYPELPPEPGREGTQQHEPIDLLDPSTHADIEDFVNSVLNRDEPHEGPKREPFGSEKPMYEIVDDPNLSEGDFDLSDLPRIGESPDIQEIESMRIRRPRVVKNPPLESEKKREVYQDIANHRKQLAMEGKPQTRESTLNMLMNKHGFDAATADRHLENFNRLQQRPEGVGEVQQPQRGRVRRRKFSKAGLDRMDYPEEQFNPTHTTVPEKDRTDLSEDDMYGMIPGYAKPIHRDENYVTYLLDPKTNNVYARIMNNRVVGYSVHGHNYTDLHVAKEHRGQGIGKTLASLFIKYNPKHDVGGFTKGGRGVYRSALKNKLSRRRFAKPKRVHREIGGKPYVITPTEQGFGITPADNPINRISKSYHVQLGESGRPVSCTCPDYAYRGGICKHMRAIAEMQAEQGQEMAPEFEPRIPESEEPIAPVAPPVVEPEEPKIVAGPEKTTEKPVKKPRYSEINIHRKSRYQFSKQILVGGKGDKLSPKDVDPEQLRKGIRVEMEHTKDEKIAREIALDHLAEDPHYYTKLAKMENKKYSAYRAPAGGMIARGTHYRGGEMVPSMTGKFMNPPKPKKAAPLVISFDAKKLAALRHHWRLKVKKMPPALAEQDGTSAPVTGEKKSKIPT